MVLRHPIISLRWKMPRVSVFLWFCLGYESASSCLSKNLFLPLGKKFQGSAPQASLWLLVFTFDAERFFNPSHEIAAPSAPSIWKRALFAKGFSNNLPFRRQPSPGKWRMRCGVPGFHLAESTGWKAPSAAGGAAFHVKYDSFLPVCQQTLLSLWGKDVAVSLWGPYVVTAPDNTTYVFLPWRRLVSLMFLRGNLFLNLFQHPIKEMYKFYITHPKTDNTGIQCRSVQGTP